MSWPVEIDGLEFHPIPASWIDAGDHCGDPDKRLYAVSAALTRTEKFLRIRYAHPISGQVLLGQHGTADNPRGDGVVPAGLARGTGWCAAKTPHPDVEPVEPLRASEWEHLEELWSDRLGLDELQYDVDRGRGVIADGGEASDAEVDRSLSGTEQRYECVSIVKTLREDPVNDHEKGNTWFVPGRHFDGDDYKVMTDDGTTVAIPTETVTVIELPDLFPGDEATELAREQATELIKLGQRYVDADAPRSESGGEQP